MADRAQFPIMTGTGNPAVYNQTEVWRMRSAGECLP
jgi:hypothetical protein